MSESLTISFNPSLAAGTMYSIPLTGSNSSVGTIKDNNGVTIGTLNQNNPTFTTIGATSSITLQVTSGYYTDFGRLGTAFTGSGIVGFQPSNDAANTTWGLGSNGGNAGLTDIEDLFREINTDLLTGTGNHVYFPNYCPNTITNMRRTFFQNNVDIAVSGLSTWQTGNVTSFFQTFRNSRKIAVSLGNWDVTSVTTFQSMFLNMGQTDALDATQINNWTLPSSSFTMLDFCRETTMNLDISTNGTKWVMTGCTNASNMFNGNTTFNQNIGNWDTSNITDMNGMFRNATAFNQDISSWDTSSVTNMSNMFEDASAFNQDIRSWDVSTPGISFNSMFKNATLMINNYSAPITPTAAFFAPESLTITFNPPLAAGTMFSIPLTGSNSSVGTIKDNNGVTIGTLNQNNPIFTTTGATSSITLQVTSGYYTTFGRLGTSMSGIVGFQPSNDATSTTWGLGSNGANAGLTNITDMFREINTDLLTGTGNYVYFPNYCPNTITNMTRTFHNNNNVDIAVAGLSTWQTGNVTDFFHTFRLCRKITVSLGNWDVTSATTFRGMFQSMSETDALDATQINNWTLPSSSFNMQECFREMDMNVDISTNGTKWVMTGCTNANNMFNSNTTFNQNIGNWDTSNITDMNGMFRSATAFNQEIRSWDVSNVTDFSNMFKNATLMINNFSAPTTPTAAFFTFESLTITFNPPLAANTYTLPLTGSNSSVGTIKDNNGSTVGTLNQDSPTFTITGATSSITLAVASGYYTTFGRLSNVMSNIVGFQPSNDAQNTTWGLGSNGANAGLTNIANLFENMNTDLLTGTGNYVYFPNNCPTTITSLRRTFYHNNNVDIAVSGLSTWQTGNVTDFYQTFRNSRKITVSLGNWDVTSSTDFDGMFKSMSQVDAIDATQINNWTLPSSSFTMTGMFQQMSMNLDISTNGTKWVTTACTKMNYMFDANVTFNQNIGNWNTSNVTTFQFMFKNATAFNQDISSWNTSNVTNLEGTFNNATAFNQDISSWNTSNVTTLRNAFSGASAFDQPIGSWNTSNVTDMFTMFYNSPFNQDITSWNVSNVTNFGGMFDSVTEFNQDIRSWDVSSGTNFGSMFNGATSMINNFSAPTTPTKAFFQPVLSNISSIGTTNDNTPSFTITSSKAGNVTLANNPSSLSVASASLTSGSNTVTFNNITDGTYSGITITITDAAGTSSAALTIPDIIIDTTAPVISQVTAITTPGNDTTPSYVFTTSEAGTITSNLAFSSSSAANSGNNTITFNTLAEGTYTGKTITVTDAAGNASNTLTIPDFVIDTTAPVISQVTAITTPGNDTTPSYIFSSDKTGTITSNLTFTSSSAASSGNNTITFDTLAPGTYTGKTITVTDAAGNASNTLTIPDFVIDTTAPTAAITYDSVGPYKNGETVVITATFNEAMLDSPVPQITITGSGIANVNATNMTKVSTTVYTFSYSVPTGDGTGTITLTVGTDLAGNTITVNPTSGNTFTVDNTAPVISQVTAITTPGNDNTPSYVFSSDQLGTITSNLAFSSTTSASIGNNTITFSTLADGTYTGKTITVTDAAGNASNTLTIPDFVIDTTAPTISQVTAIATPGNDTTPSYVFNSNQAGTITSNLAFTSSTSATVGENTITFSTLAEGSYTGKNITVTDAAGNASNLLVIPDFVIDTTLPVLTLIGANPLPAELGNAFTDPGATSNGGETVSVSGTVNKDVIGDYTLTYSATDAAGNTGTITRNVQVRDNTAPVITLNGANPLDIQQHDTYTEPGATADGGETVSITGSVNVDVLGNYTITYSAADNVGNTSVISRTVRVIDDVPATITLIGPNPLILSLGATFIDPGATSSGGEIVRMTTSLNTLVAGDYNVTYNSIDKNSNVGTAVRVVRVVNNEAYIGPKLKTLHNGITTAQNGMPLKDSTSDGGSSFSMGRMFFSRTYEAKPATEAAVLQVNKNKWIGSNRDASSVARNRRNQAIGSNELNTSGSSMSFTNTNEENNIRNAVHRTRSGGSRVPAKVFNKNSGGSFYS